MQETPGTAVLSPLPYTPLGSAEVERMLRRSQADVGAGDGPVTPDISPLPYTPPKQRGGAAHAETSSKTTKNGPPTFSAGGTSSRWAASDPGERTGRSILETHVTPTSHFFWWRRQQARCCGSTITRSI